MTGVPPGELVSDDDAHKLRATHRQVDGNRGAGARPDHDGRGRGPRLQDRRRIGRVRGDRMDGVAA
jgi:hypothetical protein